MNIWQFKTKIWKWQGQAAWHFASLPKKISREIDKIFKDLKRGWGSLPVNVNLGKTIWKTSIFPDSKTKTYLLPIKSEVRKKENLKAGQEVIIKLSITDI